MNESQAGQILLVFRAAYPHMEITPDMAQLWINSLAMSDDEAALRAARRWVETRDRWPTIAQFNGFITDMAREIRDERPAVYRSRAVRCDGTGWFDQGNGLEACPHCNPWNLELIRNGDWNNTRMKAPDNWVQPRPCEPFHTDSETFTFTEARAAMERGYREHHAEIGTDPAEVDRLVSRLFARQTLTVGQSTR